MQNAKDANVEIGYQRILTVGQTGSGKTSQIWSLPGRKFAYIFDPNALLSLQGLDIDYEEFLPDPLEMDATLKGFNKGSRDDTPASRIEPKQYILWGQNFNEKVEEGFFENYDWLIFDSLTFLQRLMFDRNAYINNRYGKIEELSDYRVVGSKESDLFRSITSMKINIYATGHIREFQDELTKKVSTEMNLAGSAKTNLPLMFSNIWYCTTDSSDKGTRYKIQTRPERRGLQTIRTTIKGLNIYEDVTIDDWENPEKYGIGNLISETMKHRVRLVKR